MTNAAPGAVERARRKATALAELRTRHRKYARSHARYLTDAEQRREGVRLARAAGATWAEAGEACDVTGEQALRLAAADKGENN